MATSAIALSPCSPLVHCTPAQAGCGDGNLLRDFRIVPRVVGGTVILWDYNRASGLGPRPKFQVQVGRADAAEDAWAPISGTIGNNYFFIDNVRRDAGFYRRTYYRLQIKGNGRTVYSQPKPADSQLLNTSQRRLYDEILRREQMRYGDKESPASTGYLLKVRYHGDPCPECTDPDSGQSYKSDCSRCYGVGYDKGYYPPFPCFHVDLDNMAHDLKMFAEQGPAIQGGTRGIRYLNIPAVHPWDVWVDAASDHRYLIGQIVPITSFGVYPLICNAAASQLSFDDPVYKIPVS
jgi:hypothetical protein